MDIRNSKAICTDAQQALSAQRFDPKKLALLHTGAAAIFSLLLTVVHFVLEKQMENAVGLSGVGLRSVLATAQSVLSIASFAIIPFWEFGFTAAGLRFSRQQQAEPATLLEGFRRWGGVLRLTILRFIYYIAIMFVCAQVATVVYTFTPFSAPFMDAMLTAMESGAALDETALQALLPSLIPLYIIAGILLCIVLIPAIYRLRFAEFALLDSPRPAALPAMFASWRMLRKNCLSLFRLDLQYWWYYLLSAVISVVGYGDLIAASLNIHLPFSSDTAFFVFYLLHLACQIVLSWQARSRITATYAVAYDTLLSGDEPVIPAITQ